MRQRKEEGGGSANWRARTLDPGGEGWRDQTPQPFQRRPRYTSSAVQTLSFLKTYHRLGLRDQIPLMGLPFTVDDRLLDEIGEPALGVRSLSCWRTDTPEHRRFAEAFATQTGRPVHCYALLAYETGHLLARAATQIGVDRPVAGQLADALRGVEFRGPRGVVGFDARTRKVTTPCALTSWKSVVRALNRNGTSRSSSGISIMLLPSGRNQNAKPRPERFSRPPV